MSLVIKFYFTSSMLNIRSQPHRNNNTTNVMMQ